MHTVLQVIRLGVSKNELVPLHKISKLCVVTWLVSRSVLVPWLTVLRFAVSVEWEFRALQAACDQQRAAAGRGTEVVRAEAGAHNRHCNIQSTGLHTARHTNTRMYLCRQAPLQELWQLPHLIVVWCMIVVPQLGSEVVVIRVIGSHVPPITCGSVTMVHPDTRTVTVTLTDDKTSVEWRWCDCHVVWTPQERTLRSPLQPGATEFHSIDSNSVIAQFVDGFCRTAPTQAIAATFPVNAVSSATPKGADGNSLQLAIFLLC